MAHLKQSYDLVVVGGGIFGLWITKKAADYGLSVLLAEKNKIGSGASGGLLGALMPHIPTGWNAKKDFQFKALVELEAIARKLEEETGLKTGYARCGRIMPLRKERFLKLTEERQAAAQTVWKDDTNAFRFEARCDTAMNSYLASDAAPFGYAFDSLAARIHPRSYRACLTASLAGKADLIEGLAFDHQEDGVVLFNDGRESVRSPLVVLAGGYQTFDLLNRGYDLDLGTGIKGQAALFKPRADHKAGAWPVLYDDGVYVVPHDDGTLAVGSTSDKLWQDPDLPDPSRWGFLDKARALCPPLRDAELLEEWAGVRPKCHERDPAIGYLPQNRSLYVASGGFKISFGIAHRIAEAVLEEITAATPSVQVPETFRLSHHLETLKEVT